MFSHSHNFTANNCQFIDNSSSDSKIGIDILLKASTPEAAYDSSARNSAPRCFPGTREQYIEDIIHWALPGLHSSKSSSLFRVQGPAGVGKSALAQSCVEKIKVLGRPCAGFFFSINGRNLKKSERLFPSIAYQLSTVFPAYRDLLDQKIRRDKTLVDKTMASQFRSLLVEPVEELEKNGVSLGPRIPIFIDGLDECEGASAQCQIIEIIASSVRNDTTPFCWAFFSRPEPHLEHTFCRPDVASLCHMAILPISRDIDGEIELYLRANLQNMVWYSSSPKSPWPSDSDMKVLVRGAGGLFIYAATVLRVVSRPSSLALEERLSEIVTAIQDSSTNSILRPTSPSPFADLDAFYMLIMRRVPADILPIIQLLCAVLCMYTGNNIHRGISAMVLSNLLRVSGPTFHFICSQLSAVIHFRDQRRPFELGTRIRTTNSSPDFMVSELSKASLQFIDSELGGSISFHHKSFYDFLIDPARSGTFCATSPSIRSILLNHLIDLQLGYEKSYCIRNSELTLAPGIPDSAFSLSNPYTNELFDSFIKINVYMRASGMANTICNLPELDPTLRKRLRNSDYLKKLIIFASWSRDTLAHTWCWECRGLRKVIRTTMILWSHGDRFEHFDIALFEDTLKRQQQAGIWKPYFFRSLRFQKHLLRGKFNRSRVKSGLFLKGQGSKSIFWYWEINYELRCYREFHTADLEEGLKIFQAIPWDDILSGTSAIDWEKVEREAGFKCQG